MLSFFSGQSRHSGSPSLPPPSPSQSKPSRFRFAISSSSLSQLSLMTATVPFCCHNLKFEYYQIPIIKRAEITFHGIIHLIYDQVLLSGCAAPWVHSSTFTWVKVGWKGPKDPKGAISKVKTQTMTLEMPHPGRWWGTSSPSQHHWSRRCEEAGAERLAL